MWLLGHTVTLTTNVGRRGVPTPNAARARPRRRGMKRLTDAAADGVTSGDAAQRPAVGREVGAKPRAVGAGSSAGEVTRRRDHRDRNSGGTWPCVHPQGSAFRERRHEGGKCCEPAGAKASGQQDFGICGEKTVTSQPCSCSD